tara:strand:- start:1156 stop:2427 length:1272 start_codon:yes stop_codon:yes gene_type:complete
MFILPINMFYIKKINYQNINIFNFFFLILIFLPKIDLISIPGFWQGIRFDDLIIALYAIALLKYRKDIVYSDNKFFKGWFYFLFYLLISNLIALLQGLSIEFIMLLRVLEYSILLIFIYNQNLDSKYLKKIIKVFLVLNLLIVVFQKLGLIGTISSVGYQSVSAESDARAYGLLGGSWELAVISSLSYFILILVTNSKKEKFLFLLITCFLLYVANSRMPIGAFIISLIIIFINSLKDKIYQTYKSKFNYSIFLLILMLFISIAISVNYYDPSIDVINKFKNYLIRFDLEGNTIFKLISDLILYNEVPGRKEFYQYDFSYWSLLYRLEHWSNLYEINLSSPVSFITGSGLNTIYTDSLLIRIILNCGIIGIIIIVIFTFQIPVFILTYLFLTGLTLDLFVSMKIFIFTLLLIKAYRNHANYSK